MNHEPTCNWGVERQEVTEGFYINHCFTTDNSLLVLFKGDNSTWEHFHSSPGLLDFFSSLQKDDGFRILKRGALICGTLGITYSCVSDIKYSHRLILPKEDPTLPSTAHKHMDQQEETKNK